MLSDQKVNEIYELIKYVIRKEKINIKDALDEVQQKVFDGVLPVTALFVDVNLFREFVLAYKNKTLNKELIKEASRSLQSYDKGIEKYKDQSARSKTDQGSTGLKAVTVMKDSAGSWKARIDMEGLDEKRTRFIVNIRDVRKTLRDGEHGFHVHEAGDLTDGCTSLCAHYNPLGKNHGGLNETSSHAGDLGNIPVKDGKTINYEIIAENLPLKDIIGRSLIIHADRDDLGRGGDEESLKTGNAGERVLCGVIGYKNKCK
jgi:Cu-Zn family superoxide dismutase